MSLLTKFIPAPLRRIKTMQDWVSINVTASDTVERRSATNTDQQALINRAHGWMFRAAAQNARSVCAQPLRLYVPAGNKAARKAYGTRRLTRKSRSWIDRRGQVSMGAKAVQYAELAGEVEEIVDHPALRLMRYGNDFMSGVDLLELTLLFRELTGNGYWHVTIDDGEPSGLWPLMPQHTFIIADERDFIRSYVSGRQGHLVHEFAPEEIIHHKHMQSFVEPFYGYTWLRAAVYAADIYTASRIHERSTWNNGARPDYAVMLKGTGYTPEQAERIQRRLTAKHGGPHKSGQPIVVGANDIEIQPLQFTPKEMEYVLGLNNVRDEIMALADIPKSLYTSDDVNLANATIGARVYAEQAILPRLVKLADTLTDQLLPYYGVEEGEMWFGFDNPVPEDEAQQLERRSRMVTTAQLTVNESRAEDGLDPSDDEMADKLLFNGQPLGQAAQEGSALWPALAATDEEGGGEAPETAEAPRANPADREWVSGIIERVSGGELPAESAVRLLALYAMMSEEDARALVEPAEEQREEKVDAAPDAPPGDDEPPPDDDTPSDDDEPDDDDKAGVADRAEIDSKAEPTHEEEVAMLRELWGKKDILRSSPFTDRPEERFVREVLQWLRRLGRAVAENPQQFLAVGLPEYPGKAFEGQWIAALADILRRGTTEALLEGAADGARMLGNQGIADAISFDVSNPAVAQFLAQRDALLIRAAESITETTDEILRSAITRGIDEGLSVSELAGRVEEVMGETSPDRALMIARTESAQAQVEGQRAQWMQFEDEAGVRMGKVWRLAPNACEICQAIKARHGEEPIPLDQPFARVGETIAGGDKSLTVKIRDVQGPPIHPNDRCSLKVVQMEEAAV